MSGWKPGAFAGAIKAKLAGNDASAAKDDSDATDEDSSSDKFQQKIVRIGRAKFLAKGLVGSICVSQTFGLATLAINIDVNGPDVANLPDQRDEIVGGSESKDMQESLSRLEQAACNQMDRMISRLIRQAARNWSNVPYAGDVTLSMSVSVGVSVPGTSIGIEIGIEFSISVASLIASSLR